MSNLEREPVTMPGLSGMETGTIVEWRKASGDRVTKGEIIAVVDADKVTIDVEAPVSGTIEISADEEAEVAVGEPIAWIQITR